MSQQQLVFVMTDGSARIRPADRRLIRSQCMNEKNKRPDSRRSKRAAARVAGTRKFEKEYQKGDSFTSQAVHPTTTCERVSSEGGRKRERQQASLPPPPPSDWALFQFPEELDIFSQGLLYRYFLRNPIRDPLCPFKLVGIHIDIIDDDPSWCFRSFVAQKLTFHAFLLLASASNDLIQRRPLSNTTCRHLQRTLRILNNQFSDDKDAHRSDTILYVVGILASIAILFGDYNAAKVHGAGISQIIRLRGGFRAANHIPAIQLSLDRLNFSSMLVTKLWTPIYDDSFWRESPVFPAEIIKVYHSQQMLSVDGLVDPNLASVFRSLQHTTILLNKHYYSKTPIDGVFLQECVGFVHSKLVQLEGQLKDELSECLRLAMMAFCATTFRLPDLYEHPCCKSLAKELRLSYAAVKASIPNMQEAVDIWLMFVCLISTNDMDEICRWEGWQEISKHGMSWNEIRRQVKQVMWIDAFHDDLGRKAFVSLVARHI